MTRRFVITGATGLIGRALCRQLLARGDELTILSRDPAAARRALPGAAAYLEWSGRGIGQWAAALDGADGVVHLAGSSIAGQRWSEAYKREILASRVEGTRAVVTACAQAARRPRVLVSASGIDYYGPHGDEPLDEQAPPGSTFLAQVCVAWEAEAARAAELGVRTCAIRTGLVLDRDEGALARLLLPFRLFAGGPILPGTQWWSWIHRDDIVGLYMLALDDERASGALNGTAPEPERNQAFAATLGRVLGRPALAPTPGFALDLLLGEMARALLIERQRVIPHRALELGYVFRFPRLEPALRDLLGG